jgi:hypothetical protein
MPSSLDQAFHKVASGLGSVATVLGRPNGPRELLTLLGWDLPPGVNDIGLSAINLTDLLNKVEQLDLAISVGTSGLELDADYASVAVALGSFLQGIDAIVNGFAATPDYLAKTNIVAQFVPRLLDFVVVEALQSNSMVAFGFATFVGVIEFQLFDADPSIFQVAHIRRTIHWDRIPRVFGDIRKLLAEVYGWGVANFDATPLIVTLGGLLHALSAATTVRALPRRAERALVGHDVPEADTNPMTQLLLSVSRGLGWDPLDAGISIVALRPSASGAADAGFAMAPYLHGTTDLEFPLSDQLTFVIDATLDVQSGIALIVRANTGVSLKNNLTAGGIADVASGHLLAGLRYVGPGGGTLPLLTVIDGVGIETGSLTVSGGVDVNGGVLSALVKVKLASGKFELDTSKTDSFLASLIPLAVNLAFDLEFGWSSSYGLYVEGNGSPQFDLGLNQSLGPFTITTLHIGLTLGKPDLPLEVSLTGKGSIGPFEFSVERLGLTADLAFQRGNLGPVNLSLALKPPTGLGILVDMGLVTGGGFISFDPDKGRYAGILDLAILDVVTVKVIGVLDTILPNGTPGFSLLLVITFDLPPIQLGFGFTLSGVGGLGGLNRTMAQDALRAGLRAHTLDSVLFPPDPIDNAPQIISDIESFFPPQLGRYLFGPMMSIGWGTPTLLDFEVGVILEVPDPVRLAILGEIKVAIPDPDVALIQIHIDVLGLIDFGLEKLSIDGTTFDSYLLTFQLAGDMALRFNWGDNANFLVSFGGFNPHFSPPPDIPQLQRLSVSLGVGDNPRLSSNSYFAVTSNSLQFGANVDAYAAAGGFAVHGYIGFDTLFIFSPFSFEIDFSAGFDISFEGTSLAGIQLNASLSGPRPFHLHGDASFHILFFDVSASIDLTWGDSTPATLPSAPVFPPLLAALGNAGNWSVALPPTSAQAVSLRTVTPSPGGLVAHPMGTLTVRETIVPLDITITQFNGVKPSDGTEFQITAVALNATAAVYTAHQEEFAIAQFTTLSDADKLSAPSYEPFDAGVAIGAQPITNGDDSARTVVYEERYIDDYNQISRFGSFYSLPANIHGVLMNSGAGAAASVMNTGLKKFTTPGMTTSISVGPGLYIVASTTDLSPRADILASGTTRYEALTAMQAHLSLHPEEREAVQVLPVHEMAA